MTARISGPLVTVLVAITLIAGCRNVPHDRREGGGGSDGLDRRGLNPQASTPATRTGSTEGRRLAPPADDPAFVRRLSSSAGLMVAVGRLAQTKAVNPQLRELCALMADDYSRIARDLAVDAAAHRAPAGAGGDDTSDTMRRLERLSGDDFDRAVLEELVWRQDADTDAFANRAESADSRYKGLAAEQLPVLRQRAQRLQELRASQPPS